MPEDLGRWLANPSMNRSPLIAAVVLLAWAWPRWWPESGPEPLSPDRELASFFPERCRIYLEGTGAGALFEKGLEHPFVHALLTSPLGAALLSRAPGTPEQALAVADAWLGQPVLPLVAELTRGGVGLGIDPGTKKAVVVLRGRAAEPIASALTTILDGLERQLGWPGAFDEPAERERGAELWSLGDATLARCDTLLVLGNERALVDDVLDLAAEPVAGGLSGRPGFSRHHAEMPADATLWAWFDLAEIEPHADRGFRELRAANHAPAAQGLLGTELTALLAARALSATLALRDRSLELGLRAFEAPSLSALAPGARTGALPAEVGGESTATALVYRDYSRFFTQRVEHFPPETLPGFAEAITGGALFFEGRDLGEEVLPHLSPWIRLVSRELDYDEGRRPEIPLPGLAAVAVLDDEREGERWAAAFQTLVALINVDRAQKGGQNMQLRLAREDDVEISSARFATPAPGDGVDLRYNLEPALAVVGRHLVLGTHLALVRELVREIGLAEPRSPGDEPEALQVDSSSLHAVVERNFEFLVARKMLEDGFERGAAEREIDGLRLALASFEGARLEVVARDPTAPEVRLVLRLTRGEDSR
jgi:hypothetical protein